MPDLLDLTAELVEISSVSLEEAPLADEVERRLKAVPGLAVERLGDNVVARTTGDRPRRVVLAGHLDTVPRSPGQATRIEGDVLWGLGAADMKGGLAVMLALAEGLRAPACEVTWVFYVGEEIAAQHNGLGHLFRDRPDLVAGDVALLGEPTGAALEAGCQGTLRVQATFTGLRAHTARPWMGTNAVHRLAPVLTRLATYEERRPVLDGCEYREALQAVAVGGGVAGNVVPDRVELVLNHRFAPDRDAEGALAHVRAELVAAGLDDAAGDEVEVLDVAPGALPALQDPVLRGLIDRGAAVRAKLGWTDVARFAAAGIPAANFGPGDPTLAHRPDERVERADVERCYALLAEVLTSAGAG